jgi:hypothetical protein
MVSPYHIDGVPWLLTRAKTPTRYEFAFPPKAVAFTLALMVSAVAELPTVAMAGVELPV